MSPLLAVRSAVLAVVLALAAPAARAQPDPVREPFAAGRTADYEGAVEAYLERVGRVGDTELGGMAARDIAQLALIVPAPLADRLRDPDPGLGPSVRAWWRAQDPLPATPINERVVEHMLRVVAAEAAFGADRPTGLDARGETFVRFGSPARRRVIDFEGDLFIAQAIRDEPAVRLADFPPNEAWHYPALGPDVFFVFAELRGVYEHADPLDLIPRALQAGGLNYETRSRSRLLGQALRWLYKDLSTYSADVRNRLLTLDATMGGDGTVFEGNTALVLQSELQRARLEDADARDARDATIPAGTTELRGRPFGIVRQAAAFLDGPPDDPTVSVWVGWAQTETRLSATADSLARMGIATGHFVLSVTSVGYGPQRRRGETSENLYLLDEIDEVSEPQWAVVEGLAGGGFAAVEWDLYPATAQAEVMLQTPVAYDVLRVDSVGVRRAGALALSGLLAVNVEEARVFPEPDRLGAFPDAEPLIRAGDEVAVYYEVYRSGDRSREVEVEIRSVQRRTGQLLRRGFAVGAAAGGRLTLDAPRTPLVAFVDADAEGADALVVEVAVTDVETGAEVVQEVTFDLR